MIMETNNVSRTCKPDYLLIIQCEYIIGVDRNSIMIGTQSLAPGQPTWNVIDIK